MAIIAILSSFTQKLECLMTSQPADLPVIDTDAHVTEPADLWTARLARKYHDAPTIEYVPSTSSLHWRIGR